MINFLRSWNARSGVQSKLLSAQDLMQCYCLIPAESIIGTIYFVWFFYLLSILHWVIRSKCKCLNHIYLAVLFLLITIGYAILVFPTFSRMQTYIFYLKKQAFYEVFLNKYKLISGLYTGGAVICSRIQLFLIKYWWLWYLRFSKMPIQWLLLQFWKLFRVEAFRLPWTDKIPSTECACVYLCPLCGCRCGILRYHIRAHGQNPR